MSDAAAVVFLLAFIFGVPLAIYLFIRKETSNPTVVDRREAEREAMAQGGLQNRSRGSDVRTGGSDGQDTSTDTRETSTDGPDSNGNWWDER